MKLFRTLRKLLEPQFDDGDAKYEHAMDLATEVTDRIRERAQSVSPFREILGEMLMRAPYPNPVLIADAFEAGQESRIFKGPPNGRG